MIALRFLSARAALVVGRPQDREVFCGAADEFQPGGGAAAPSPRPHRQGALIARRARDSRLQGPPPAGAGAGCLLSRLLADETEWEVP